MPPPAPSRRGPHPAAVGIFILGVALLVAGRVRVWLTHPPSTPVQPVAAASAEREPGPMRIVVTIPPLLWPVKALAPDDAEITLLAPAGAGCEGLELSPRDAAAVRRADLLVRVGFGLDDALTAQWEGRERAWRKRVACADVVWPRELIPLGSEPQTDTESHDHPAVNPHIWLDPAFMERFIGAIAKIIEEFRLEDARARLGPSRTQDLDLHSVDHLLEFMKEQTALQDAAGVNPMRGVCEELKRTCRLIGAEYHERLLRIPSRAIVTQHHAWAYLARHYNLEIAAVLQPSHDAEPSPADIAAVTRVMLERNIKAVFIEPQLNPALARRVAGITGAKTFTLDPLGDGDWPAMMRKNLDALVAGLSSD